MAASTALALPGDALTYERHRPEQTPLYALIEEHFPRFLERLDAEGVSLPHFVIEEFEAYLKCGRLEHGFLRVKCDTCRHEKRVAFSCKRRGFCPSCGARRMADTAAHLVEHVLPEQPIRQWVLSFPYPLRFLFATRPAVLTQVLGIVYRAVSTFLVRRAGLRVGAGARTAVSNERPSVNDRGQVVYRLKHPFRDGTTDVVLDPMNFIARLAALIPRPRAHLTRYHGVFAPNFKHRRRIIPNPALPPLSRGLKAQPGEKCRLGRMARQRPPMPAPGVRPVAWTAESDRGSSPERVLPCAPPRSRRSWARKFHRSASAAVTW